MFLSTSSTGLNTFMGQFKVKVVQKTKAGRVRCEKSNKELYDGERRDRLRKEGVKRRRRRSKQRQKQHETTDEEGRKETEWSQQ